MFAQLEREIALMRAACKAAMSSLALACDEIMVEPDDFEFTSFGTVQLGRSPQGEEGREG